MKSFILFLAVTLCACLQSCEKANAEDTLCQAESDLNSGNLELALSSCDMLTDTTATDLTATQMCRVAIIYAKISELADNQDYMASATQCYERALKMDLDTDSLERYVETLDVESQNVVRVIREVTNVLNSPCDYTQNTSDEDEEEYVEQSMRNGADQKTAQAL